MNVSKEYIRRIRKVLKSKLNGGNLVHGVNTLAVSLLRYSAAFVSWRKSELQAIDRKTRNLFTICGTLHPKSDVDRLYIPRKEYLFIYLFFFLLLTIYIAKILCNICT